MLFIGEVIVLIMWVLQNRPKKDLRALRRALPPKFSPEGRPLYIIV